MPNDQAGFYFHQGTNFYAYDYLGCHLLSSDSVYVYIFRVWAPNAARVCLISDFTDWDRGIDLERITARGVWELIFKSPHSLEGEKYKFLILTEEGKALPKGDPYAFSSLGGADGASLVTHPTSFVFLDDAWLAHRSSCVIGADGKYLSTPMNVYEVHAASFMRHSDGKYLTYRELADVLLPYVKSMGYTHVEFLPLAEYPYDGSWGYQIGAFYAPTSRFGCPDDLRYFVNCAHTMGIGVLLDWVPAHFPKDAWGLYEFDGKPLYEYQGHDRMESPSWGTRYFDLGREEVQSFLISNALYFLREFHLDGLRVDAVAAMLYLDFDRAPGQWVPNEKGGRENLEAIAFLRKLNQAILSEFPDVLMIAEESTDFPGVTHPVSDGGLGFSMKWNMGLANDLYAYVSRDPIYRRYHHNALNFPLMYIFKENYMNPISHDEVVHGKRSFIDKMYGSYTDKFRQARVSLLLMMTYPGKKMLFMGTEYAQFREWDHDSSLEWFMLEYPLHKQFRDYVASLNRFYLECPALYELDFDEEGFRWIDPDDSDQNAVSFYRYDREGNRILIIISFSGAATEFLIPLAKGTVPEILFESDGSRSVSIQTEKQGKDLLVRAKLPSFSGVILREKPQKMRITLPEKKAKTKKNKI